MIHDHPMSAEARSVVEMPGKDQVGIVGLCLYCHIGAFSIELHEYDVEIAVIGHIQALINPRVQDLD